MKMILQPIRVFCFHQVSDVFDPVSMWECDWMSTHDFKNKINKLQKEYTFISLTEAYEKLKHDTFRSKKYAVLTSDDGSKTIECILSWLKELHIPITLFLNGSFLDGVTYRYNPTERFMTKEDKRSYAGTFMSIGHHGWNHKDLMNLSDDEFESSIYKNTEMLSDMPNLVPFWAYPYGTHTVKTDERLKKQGYTPVYMDGQMNYNDSTCIHRELL
jgi:peptidoglycan/xylan/chitin deacetylase (PgdA/CDA1 family)